MRQYATFLSLTAILFSSLTTASEILDSRLEARDITLEDPSALLKRTFGGGFSTCEISKKLIFHHEHGSCGCQHSHYSCGKKESECPGPKTSGCGQAACSSSGCTITCNSGMVLNKKKDDCVCAPGYVLAGNKKYCTVDTTPITCPAGSTLKNHGGKCECSKTKCGRGETSCPGPKTPGTGSPTCMGGHCGLKCNYGMVPSKDGKDCVCEPGCKKHPSGGFCTPHNPPPSGPSQHAHHPGKPHHPGHPGKPELPKPELPGKHHGHHKKSLPVWSAALHTRDQDSLFCPDSLSACAIDNSTGYECVDTMNEIENCGGCSSEGQGQDCTLIPFAGGIGCSSGKCVVFSCVDGFALNSSGDCVATL